MIEKIILKKNLIGFNGEELEAGEIINLSTLSYSEKGFWKNRLEDSKIDGCVEIYKPLVISTNKKKGDK